MSQQMKNLCRRILKDSGMHAAGTDAADFFFIYQNTAGCAFRCLIFIQERHQRCERTDSVILTVADNHAPIKAQFSGFARRHHFQFRRDEIFFFKTVLFFQNSADICGNGVLLLFLLLFAVRFTLRDASNQNIQRFPLHNLRGGFRQLLPRQVNQQIRNGKYGIRILLSYGNIHPAAVLSNHNSVNCQRKRHPLILLDAAVIMGVQISESTILVQRILFHIHSR